MTARQKLNLGGRKVQAPYSNVPRASGTVVRPEIVAQKLYRYQCFALEILISNFEILNLIV